MYSQTFVRSGVKAFDSVLVTMNVGEHFGVVTTTEIEGKPSDFCCGDKDGGFLSLPVLSLEQEVEGNLTN